MAKNVEIKLNIDTGSSTKRVAALKKEIKSIASISLDSKEKKQTNKVADSLKKQQKQYKKTSAAAKKYGDNTVSSFNRIGLASQRAAASLKGNSANMVTSFGAISAGMVRIAIAAGLLIAAVSGIVTPWMDLEEQLLTIKGITEATDTQMDDLAVSARKMGMETEHTATASAKALTIMSRAGWKVAESIKALPSVLNTATATGTELSKTTNIVLGSLKAMGKEVKDLPNFLDVLVATTNSSNQTLENIGNTFKYVAAGAKSLGYSVETLSAITGVLADSSIKGTMTGRLLKGVFINNAKAAEVLGTKYDDLVGTMEAAAKAGWNLIDFEKHFGKEGATVALVLSQNTEKVRAFEKELNKAGGTVDRMASEKLKALATKLRIFVSSLSEVATSIGDVFGPTLKEVVDKATKTMRDLGDAIKYSRGEMDLISGSTDRAKESFELLSKILDVIKITIGTLLMYKVGVWIGAIGTSLASVASRGFTAVKVFKELRGYACTMGYSIQIAIASFLSLANASRLGVIGMALFAGYMMGKFLNSFESVRLGALRVMESLSGFGTVIKKLATSIYSFFRDLGPKVSGYISSLNITLEGFKESVLKAFSGKMTSLIESFEKIFLSLFSEETLEKMRNVIEKLYDFGVAFKEAIKDVGLGWEQFKKDMDIGQDRTLIYLQEKMQELMDRPPHIKRTMAWGRKRVALMAEILAEETRLLKKYNAKNINILDDVIISAPKPAGTTTPKAVEKKGKKEGISIISKAQRDLNLALRKQSEDRFTFDETLAYKEAAKKKQALIGNAKYNLDVEKWLNAELNKIAFERSDHAVELINKENDAIVEKFEATKEYNDNVNRMTMTRYAYEQLKMVENLDKYKETLDEMSAYDEVKAKKDYELRKSLDLLTGKEKAAETWKEWVESAKSSAEMVTDISIHAAEAFSTGMTDALFEWIDGTKSAKDAFKDFAASFLKEMAKMIMQQAILNALKKGAAANSGNWVGSLLSMVAGSASAEKGAVWSGGFKAFASGGVATKPTLGLIGEGSKDEAVVPLDNGQRIPVNFRGGGKQGGGINIVNNNVINVTREGGKNEQEEDRKTALAVKREMKSVFYKELNVVKRPGGLLNQAGNSGSGY